MLTFQGMFDEFVNEIEYINRYIIEILNNYSSRRNLFSEKQYIDSRDMNIQQLMLTYFHLNYDF